MKEIKIKKIKEDKEVFIANCPYCNKKFEQYYEKQLRHNIYVHIMNCPIKKEQEKKNASKS